MELSLTDCFDFSTNHKFSTTCKSQKNNNDNNNDKQPWKYPRNTLEFTLKQSRNTQHPLTPIESL